MFRTFRRVTFLWVCCIGLAIYVAPDIPRNHLNRYLSKHKRPQYEYPGGQVPVGVQVASLALEALETYVPGKTRSGSDRGQGMSMSNPQDAFFRSSADATPVEYVNQWKAQYSQPSKGCDRNSMDIGPAVQANPFAR